jgi:uncharacterized SAM-binding protein YcdF (DUF218 family)
MKRILHFAWIAPVLAVAAYIAWIAVQIQRQSTRDETRSADVIVVLGAAEYRGKPSPVLKARLDHGLDREKKAPWILTTGGAGGDIRFTEAQVGRNYLARQGVPAEEILVETESENTMQSTVAAARIMRRRGLRSCILVSDGYHIFRAKKMLEAEGLKVYGSPRPAAPHNDLRQCWLYLRQSVAYLLWTLGLDA